MTTLRRERLTRFENIIKESELAFLAEEANEKLTDAIRKLAETLVDSLNVPNDDIAVAFRGDYRVFEESLWPYAKELRDTWMMVIPDRPKKKTDKGKYGFWCTSLEDLRKACGEFGSDVLVKVHSDWKSKFRDGVAPYTVAGPASLVAVCTAKAMELRQGGGKSKSRDESHLL